MLKRDWLFILAFGIVFETRAFAQQLPDQPIEQQTEGDRQQQGQESAALPGFPVRILEEPEQSESAKREQGEAVQREIDDLVAQQLAADAAYKSFRLATAQTIIAIFGTLALMYSLYLNRKATKAAEDGVKAAVAQATLAQQALALQHKPWFAITFHDDYIGNVNDLAVGGADITPDFVRFSPNISIANISDWPAQISRIAVEVDGIEKILSPEIFHTLKARSDIWVDRPYLRDIEITMNKPHFPPIFAVTDFKVDGNGWQEFRQNLPAMTVTVELLPNSWTVSGMI